MFLRLCVQKRPLQTDGWPEVEQVQPDMINEQDLLQAKTVILNWIKDLRAQPEVSCSISTLSCNLYYERSCMNKARHYC